MFMGTPNFAAEILECLINSPHEVVAVVTQPDRPKGRKRLLTPSPVKELALKYDLPIFQPENIRLVEEYEPLLAIDTDLIVTAAYGQFIPKALLEMPSKLAINVHASLLPKYRGGAPIHYAIWKGEQETGISIIEMVAQMDAGDILLQKSLPIGNQDTVGDLFEALAKLGAKALMECLQQIEDNTYSRIPQNESDASYSPNISKEDEQIDWQQDAQEIDWQVRAFNPFPSSYTIYNGNRVKIWQGSIIRNNSFENAEPGEIVEVNDQQIIVATGDKNLYAIEEWQESGKKRMPVGEFLKGIKSTELLGTTFTNDQQ